MKIVFPLLITIAFFASNASAQFGMGSKRRPDPHKKVDAAVLSDGKVCQSPGRIEREGAEGNITSTELAPDGKTIAKFVLKDKKNNGHALTMDLEYIRETLDAETRAEINDALIKNRRIRVQFFQCGKFNVLERVKLLWTTQSIY